MAAASSLGRKVSAWLLTVILLVVAALLFYLTWLLASPSSVFDSLLEIGAEALLFALVAYLTRPLTTNPVIAQALSWGFLGMGFTVLFVTIGLYPDSTVSTISRVELAIGVLVVLVVAVLGFYWGAGQRPAEAARQEERQAWRQQPTVSAFDYTTARPPSVPPPPSSTPPPSPPPGGS
jgi:hypothetical protein